MQLLIDQREDQFFNIRGQKILRRMIGKLMDIVRIFVDQQKKENVAVVFATECISRSMMVPRHGASGHQDSLFSKGSSKFCHYQLQR